MQSEGLFKLWLPREYGGAELDLPTYLKAVEAVSRIDSAAGWMLAGPRAAVHFNDRHGWTDTGRSQLSYLARLSGIARSGTFVVVADRPGHRVHVGSRPAAWCKRASA